MDRNSFDRLARLLAGASTRRGGLKALFGAAAGLAIGQAVDSVDAAPKKGRGSRPETQRAAGKRPETQRPQTQGPCGNGKRKDNICTSDTDCCTGICNIGLGKKNKDRKGRCRCMKRNKPCTSDINCCNTLTCNQGRCSLSKPSPTPPKPADKVATASGCTPVDTCAAAQATCTTYTSNQPRGSYCLLPTGAACTAANQCAGQACTGGVCAKGLIPTGDACAGGDTCANASATCVAYTSADPAGTHCLLANGAACDSAAECVSQLCVNEVCATVAETCDVCDTCTYETVQEAIDAKAAGSTILIDEGDYVEDLTIEKDMTLRACNGAAVTITNATDGRRVISRGNNDSVVALTITDIIVEGAAGELGGGIFGWYNLTLNGITQVRSSEVGSEGVGGCIELGSGNIVSDWENDIYDDGTVGECSLTIADKAQVTSCIAGWSGGAIWMGCKGGSLTMSGQAAVTSSVAGEDGGAIWAAERVTVTLSGQAFAGGNYAGDDGGGISVADYSALRMSGTAAVQGNRSGDDGGGIAIDSYSEVDLSGQAVIAGNTSSWSGGGMAAVGCEDVILKMSDDAEIRDNSAPNSGGGVYLQNLNWDGDGPFSPVLSMRGNSKIHGNRTTQDGGSPDYPSGGGGVLASEQGEILLADQASIFNNTTARWGGGVLTSGDVTLKGTSSIKGNEAAETGGGVYLTGPSSEYGEFRPIKLKVAATAKVTGNKPDQCDSQGEATC